MQLMNVMADVFNRPPIEFSPDRQSLKAWAMYCLRDRGFKVIYAQNADFAIETKDGQKIYFNVTEDASNLDGNVGWIVHDRATNHISLVAPQS